MKRKFRLTRSIDFRRVRQQGKSYAHPLLVLVVTPSNEVGPRIGVAAGKTVGGAVQRNRAKRVIRAAMQPLLPRLVSGWDIIIIARPPLIQAEFREVQAALLSMLERAHLIENMYVV